MNIPKKGIYIIRQDSCFKCNRVCEVLKQYIPKCEYEIVYAYDMDKDELNDIKKEYNIKYYPIIFDNGKNIPSDRELYKIIFKL